MKEEIRELSIYNLNESTVDYRWKWTQYLSKVLIHAFSR